VHPLDQPGTLQFQISEAEGNGQVVLKEGVAIVDRSTEGLEPWLWYVTRIGFDIGSGMVEVECAEWRQLLYERTVPLSVLAATRAAPRVAIQLLSAANARNPTHIIPHFGSMSGLAHILPEGEPLGGLTVGAAFDHMAQETDSEWWIHYHITWTSVSPTLHWGYRRGRDLTYERHIQEGYHLSQGVYSREGSGRVRMVQVLGGGGSPADRPSGAHALGAAIAQQRAVSTGRVEPVPEDQRRKMLPLAGPALNSESLDVSPAVVDEAALLTNSRRRLLIPLSALEQVEASVGGRLPWSDLDLGDRVLLRFASARLRQGADVAARIVALQPDEAEGELTLALEVQL